MNAIVIGPVVALLLSTTLACSWLASDLTEGDRQPPPPPPAVSLERDGSPGPVDSLAPNDASPLVNDDQQQSALTPAPSPVSDEGPPVTLEELHKVPPLPVLSQEGVPEPIRGVPGTWCADEQGNPVRRCPRPDRSSELDSYTEIEDGEKLLIRFQPDVAPGTWPEAIFAQVYSKSGGFMIEFIEVTPVDPVLQLDLGPGAYNVNLIVRWPYPQGGIESRFGLTIPGDPIVRSECIMTLLGTDAVILFDPANDPAPTMVDPVNNAGCRFDRPIASVTVTLSDAGVNRFSETFYLDPPSMTFGLPLSPDLNSDRTPDRLPPGVYKRGIVVTATDGSEKGIGPHFFDSVTVPDP